MTKAKWKGPSLVQWVNAVNESVAFHQGYEQPGATVAAA